MTDKIKKHLPGDHPWQDQIIWLDSTDSTNTQAKKLALEGAPQGTVIIAGHQTGGRGRMGRSFSSPEGMGLYMSLILRPEEAPEALMHLTCAAAVATTLAIEQCAGFSPEIKWINDLVFQRRKLAGILTELVIGPGGVAAIIGIGVNCRQQAIDFPPELRDMAGSLSMFANTSVEPARLAAALLTELEQMNKRLLSDKSELMNEYRRCCITLDKDVSLLRGDEIRHGHAYGLTENGGLLVRFPDGHTEEISSGEASVRGMYGYL